MVRPKDIFPPDKSFSTSARRRSRVEGWGASTLPLDPRHVVHHHADQPVACVDPAGDSGVSSAPVRPQLDFSGPVCTGQLYPFYESL